MDDSTEISLAGLLAVQWVAWRVEKMVVVLAKLTGLSMVPSKEGRLDKQKEASLVAP